jgi:hypothetical protein
VYLYSTNTIIIMRHSAHCSLNKATALPLESQQKDTVIKHGGGGGGVRGKGDRYGIHVGATMCQTCSKYKHFDDDSWASDVHGAGSCVGTLNLILSQC